MLQQTPQRLSRWGGETPTNESSGAHVYVGVSVAVAVRLTQLLHDSDPVLMDDLRDGFSVCRRLTSMGAMQMVQSPELMQLPCFGLLTFVPSLLV